MNEKTTLIAVVLGEEYKWEVVISTNKLVIEAARRGFQEWLQDASSTAKPTAEEAKDPRYALDNKEQEFKSFMAPIRRRAITDRLAKIQVGTYSPGHGGGRGSSSTVEQRAWLEFLKLKGYKLKGKLISRIADIPRGQEYLAREAFLAGGSSLETIELDIKEGLKDWVAVQENDPSGVGGLISLEQMREKLKAQIGS